MGLVLRSVNTDGRSVKSLVDLQPIITDNREVGVAWRGARGHLALSYYRSTSDLGSQIRVVNGVGRVDRVPVEVDGVELRRSEAHQGAQSLRALQHYRRQDRDRSGSAARRRARSLSTYGEVISTHTL